LQWPRYLSGLAKTHETYRRNIAPHLIPLSLPLSTLCFPSTNDLVFRMTSVERGVFEISGKYLGAKLKVSEEEQKKGRGEKGWNVVRTPPFVVFFLSSPSASASRLRRATVDAKRSIQTAALPYHCSVCLCPCCRVSQKIASCLFCDSLARSLASFPL
jgi:hypothetical protein